MTSEERQRAYELFEQALEQPPDERSAFVAEACGSDTELRAEVDSLLEHDRQVTDGFVRPPEAAPEPHQPSPVDVRETVEAAEAPAPPPTGPQIEGYEVVRELGRGGQAVVYQAIQKSTKRKVAVKVLLEGQYASKSAQRRFEREIELVAQLKHPNIISIFHSGKTSDGRRFYVMDYVRGTPLHRYVRDKRLTLEDTLRLFAAVCEAVQHAHQKGVIHRDLKPSNVLVEADGTPKVMDFGLAKLLAGPVETLVSVSHDLVGTLPYMSPEQARGNPDEIDTRTDVYTLGVILYELLTGHYPYPVVGQIMEVLKHITETPPTPPSRQWRPDSGIARRSARKLRAGQCPIDDEVQTIVLKALSKERGRRYQSAGELARDVGHYLVGEPIEAKRDSAMYMLRKGLRKHKALFRGTAVVFAVLVAATVTSTIFYGRARTQRTRAELAATRFKTANLLLQDIIAALNPRSVRSQGPAIASAISAANQRLNEGLLSDDVDTEAQLRRLLGDVYHVFGEYDNAAQQYRKAMSLLKRTDRPATADTFESVYNVACLAAAQGQPTEAVTLLEDALPLSTEVLGREHPRIVLAEGLLAMLHGDVAGTQAAVDSYRRIADWHLRDPHLQDVEKARYLAFVVETSLDTGRALEVEVYCRKLLALDRKLYGERHVYVAYASRSLALILEAQGRLTEAEELLRQAADIYMEVLHKRAPEVGRTLADIGRVAAKQGRLADAEHELREALKILDVRAPEIWLRYDARSTLGGVLSDQGEFGEAELLLLPSYEELARDPLTWPDRRRDALQRIVRLYESWGRLDEAAVWSTKLSATQPSSDKHRP